MATSTSETKTLVKNIIQAIQFWNETTEQWQSVTTASAENSDLTFYTLSSSPVRLRVDLEHEIFTGMYLSKNYVQWEMGNGEIVTGLELNYVYYVPGVYGIGVYIARSDGKVITHGGLEQEYIDVTIKNVLNTSVQASWDTTEGTGVNQFGTISRSIAGGTQFIGLSSLLNTSTVSAPIKIKTTHAWQHFSQPDNPYVVALYADNAGFQFSESNIRGNESAPLKTSSYIKNKYAQFQKTWRFTADSTGNQPIDHIQTTINKIYARKISHANYEICDETDENAEFVGTSGNDTVYYIDDSPGFVYSDGAVLQYRLMFELDTTDWPGPYSYTTLPTEQLTNHPSYPSMPAQMQAAQTSLFVQLDQSEPAGIIFTSTGIDGHNITKNKFQNTRIPFVMSLKNTNNRIIKQHRTIKMERWTYRLPFVVPTVDINTYTVGLSGDSLDGVDLSGVSFTVDENLNDIELYSSLALTLSSDIPLYNVRLCGAITTSQGIIVGSTDEFNILPSTGQFNFFKTGEHIDYGKIINDSVLQENISENPTLARMFNSIFGTFESAPTSLGKIIHEKISNFTSNHRDLDTCSVEAVYGLASEVNVELQSYNLAYPGSLKRLVDIFSVGVRKLVGERNRYIEDYKNDPVVSVDGTVRYGRNIGNKISTENYHVTAGEPLIVREIFSSNIFKVVPTCVKYVNTINTADYRFASDDVGGLDIYPLSAYDPSWNWGLTYPERNSFSDYYDFYEHKSNNTLPASSFEQSHGLIDWDSTNRVTSRLTVNESLTGYQDWYAADGPVDSCIEHSIREGLTIL